jgi:hypothetical protein
LFVVKQRYKNLPFYIFSISLDDFILILFLVTDCYVFCKIDCLIRRRNKKRGTSHEVPLLLESL